MSVNKCVFIGRLGKDPDVKVLENGTKVAQFTIACSERGYTSANGTQVPERTEWINMVAWRGLAEIVEKYTHKGSNIYVEGKFRTRSYETTDGSKRYVTEIYAENIELLEARKDSVPPPPDPMAAAAGSAAPAGGYAAGSSAGGAGASYAGGTSAGGAGASYAGGTSAAPPTAQANAGGAAQTSAASGPATGAQTTRTTPQQQGIDYPDYPGGAAAGQSNIPGDDLPF